MSDDAKICDKGEKGLMLPLTTAEQDIGKTVRGFMYLFMLFYMFAGVNIVADYFMAAVEVICETKKRVQNKESKRIVTVTVWNATVANLTLLALGSSAPEILLSCIETMANEFYAGALGPSTIVGSAAFNLLVIVATCVVAIPDGESRRISEMAVYHVTVVFSFFAYMWLLVMCSVITPNVVEIWEACLTLAMMPSLVTISYLADRGKLNFMGLEPKTLPWKRSESGPDKDAYAPNGDVAQTVSQQGGSGSQLFSNKMSRSTTSKLHHPRVEKARQSRATFRARSSTDALSDPQDASAHSPQATDSLTLAGQNGTGGSNASDKPAGDNGHFITDTEGQPIRQPAGVLTFLHDAFELSAGAEDKTVRVMVLRRNGAQGIVSCKFHTEIFDAVPEYDYTEASGDLVFDDGETQKEIELQIKKKEPYESNREMQLVLNEPEGGAVFNPNDDGGEDTCILTITLVNERRDDASSFIVRLADRLFNIKKIFWGIELWKDQIKGAFQLGGDDEDEDGEPSKPGLVDYIDYVLTMPFRVVFGILCPPAPWAGGWILFITALALIAVVTATICDLAELFGCCMELDNEVTAITIVALGTSLPDMFASQVSARKDEYADASIVNVTGSNSVNVFLGIGIPWTFAAFYWQGNGTTEKWRSKYPEVLKEWPEGVYAVPAGSLGFSVCVFNAVALIAIVLLRCRRLVLGGELGGPKNDRVLSFIILITCWFLYVGLSIWRAKSIDADIFKYPIAGFAFVIVCFGFVVDLLVRKGKLKTHSALEEEAGLKSDSEKNPPEIVGKSTIGSDHTDGSTVSTIGPLNGYATAAKLKQAKPNSQLMMIPQSSLDLNQEIVVQGSNSDSSDAPPTSSGSGSRTIPHRE